MKPDNEYSAQRYCRFCKNQSKVHIKLGEWTILVTCNECQASYELDRF